MDRRLLFPAIAVTALAQQTSPATAEAEKALRVRAEQFYQLEVARKFREAEALVAEDTKDYYYNSGKPNLKAVKIDKVEFSADGTHATVTVIATAVLSAPGMGSQEFSGPSKTEWKLEDGQWFWYVDQNVVLDTPFGKMSPGRGDIAGAKLPAPVTDIATMQSLVSIDRTALDLSPGNDTVTITNSLPGSITLELGTHRPVGLNAEIDKTRLASGEKAVVSFRAAGNAKPSGEVHITASPIGREFVVQITTK